MIVNIIHNKLLSHKKELFWGAFIFCSWIHTFSQEYFSFHNIKSVDNKIIIVGRYIDLIQKHGIPTDSIVSKIGITEYSYLENTDSIIESKTRDFEVVYLAYGDTLRYIRYGDSIQIAYIDISASNISLDLWNCRIDKSFGFRKAKSFFLLNTSKHNFISEIYYKNKTIKIKTFGIHTKERCPFDDNMWLAFFYRNNKIWYIEFPLQCEGSIVR